MDEKLKVKIPKRFKEGLEKRFDLRRVQKEWRAMSEWRSIPVECVLCVHCVDCDTHGKRCTKCPFKKFEDKSIMSGSGCMAWIKMVLGERFRFYLTSTEVRWEKTSDKEAREQIKKLKKKARELIEWV